MAYCSKCGTQLSEGAKFCPKCGTSVSVENPTDDVIQNISNESNDVNNTQRKRKPQQTNPKPKKKRSTPKKKSFYDKHEGLILGIIGVFAVAVVGLFFLWRLGAFEGEILSIPEGRAAFIVENQNCSDTSIASINKIIMYEGNSRQDCKVEGESKTGEVFTYNGKWEIKDVGMLSFRKFYILRFKEFNLLINGDKEVCFHTGTEATLDLALEYHSIGELKPINQDEESRVSEAFNKKVEEHKRKEEAERLEELKDYLGTYYYNYCPPGMPLNISFYFKITLNPDGTFSHDGSNEETRTYMTQSSLIDGKEFPSGGRWSVVNVSGMKGVWLNFEGSWGKGSINLDNNVLEIPNMNGYKLKVRTRKD